MFESSSEKSRKEIRVYLMFGFNWKQHEKSWIRAFTKAKRVTMCCRLMWNKDAHILSAFYKYNESTPEALFNNRMMLVSWQVNINDREVQINKLHFNSTKLGSVYRGSVNVRSSECWELFRCYWITSVDISPNEDAPCSTFLSR